MGQLRFKGGVGFRGGAIFKDLLNFPIYEIGQSLRGNRYSTQYLSRTFSNSERKTWSFSCWVQRSSLEYTQQLFYSYPSSGNASSISFYNNKRLGFGHTVSSSLVLDNAVDIELTDSNGWYHILFVFDSTQSFRYKAYINGVEGEWVNDPTALAENYQTYLNGAANHYLGTNPAGGHHDIRDGAIADIHFLDGIAADVSDFGEFDAYGVWQPIEYTGSYGTNNGFNLNFSNVLDLGEDSSGSGNDFTETGYSTEGNDFWQLSTSPTLDNKNNAAKHDASQTYAYHYLSRGGYSMNGNTSSGAWRTAWSTIGFEGVNSGKWYWEVKRTSFTAMHNSGVGLAPPPYHWSGYYPGQTVDSIGIYCQGSGNAKIYRDGTYSTISGFGDFAVNDIIMVAFDADNGDIWYGSNGTWYNSGDPANGTNPTATGLPSEMIPINGGYHPSDRVDLITHVDDLEYTMPTGFKPLMCDSMTNQTVLDGEEHFQAVTYTGTGAEQSITGLKFQPDFVWIKNRDTTDWHVLFDTARGATNYVSANENVAETTNVQTLTSFDSTGFTVGTHSSVNNSGDEHVAWCWKAGSGGVSNTDGTITSNVNVNATAGFSIVTYTSNGISGATIGHGLGAVPAFILIKNRDDADDWLVYHRWMDETNPENYFMNLNDTGAAASTAVAWNNTAPTSSVFTVGNSDTCNSSSNEEYIAYVWTDIPGYSKFSRYTGLGDAANGAGPHTNTGFKPAFFMTKSESNTGSWVMHDNARDLVNTGDKALFAEQNYAEQTTWYHEFVSNGVKINHANVNANGSNYKYIYASFGKTPQRNARGGRR